MSPQLHFFLKDGGRDEADVDSDGVAHKQNNFTTLRRFALQHARLMIILCYNVLEYCASMLQTQDTP